MPKRKKRKAYKRRSKGLQLKKGTIYTLSAVGLVFAALASAASYTRNGSALIQVNDYLINFFGFFSFLIPIICVLVALFILQMKNSLSRPNISIGFIVFTISILGLFQSGMVGHDLFFYTNNIIGPILTMILFALGAFIGFVVCMNLSFTEIGMFLFSSVKNAGVGVGKGVTPLLKTKDKFATDMAPMTIKGLGDDDLKISEAKVEKVAAPAKSAAPIPMPTKKGVLPEEMILNKPLEMGMWEYPPFSLLAENKDKKRDTGDVKRIAGTIERTLQSFGVKAQVAEINVGPSVTQYAIRIPEGTKLTKITTLANDLALATEAPGGQIRIEAPIPGRSLVGIEIPNKSLEFVSLRTMLESKKMQESKSKLAVPLGLNVSGEVVVADIAKMPHTLIAGTTGSGKSVMVNAFIASILFRASPSEVKFIMIDPKRVELTGYNDIPHLLSPVIVEADQSVSALKWALKEMDKRYTKFAEAGVKNIDSYNELAGFQAIPYIVIVMDELADLMALAPVEVEDSIARLAQMARATGIHLVLATQRPSVDVITGLIKANIPCRIAFNVSSGIDSKVVIDSPGAEKLLGKGDMLFVPPDQARPTRIQGTFVSDQDVKRLVNFIKSKGIPVEYTSEVIEQAVNIKGRGGSLSTVNAGGDGRDELFEQTVRMISQHDRASASLIQRRLQVGFNRAARLLEQLEEAGVVGPADGSKPRDVLVRNADEFLNGPQQEEVSS
jgi:S-DNA-T family DNA segregation ATPase FtsK/SpoIIIE